MKIKTALTASVALVMVLAGTESALAVQPTGVTNLLGTWTNVNPTTGGVVKIEITNPGGVFTIHTYGACSPTPCDHGAIPASAFSKSVSSATAHGLSGQYNFGFSTVLVTAQRTYDIDGGSFLEVETRTKFANGDTRNDYIRSELFRK